MCRILLHVVKSYTLKGEALMPDDKKDLLELLPKHIDAIYAMAAAVADLAQAVGDMVAMGSEDEAVSKTYLDGSEIEP